MTDDIKPAFDPSQPFEPVQTANSGGDKPAFDPTKPFAPGAAPAAPAGGFLNTAKEGAKGLLRGAAGFAGDIGEAVAGPFGPSHHAANLMADLGFGERPKTEPTYGQQLSHAAGIEANPQAGTAGRYAGAVGETLGDPSSYFGPGGWLSKILMGAAAGAGGEAAAQAAEGTGWEGPARAAGSLAAGPVTARVAKPQLAPAQQMLTDRGITQMTPGQLTGGLLKDFEDKLTSVPILGNFIQNSRGRSIESFNRSVANQALEPIGETLNRRTAAGHDTIGEVRDKLSHAYDQLVPHLELRPDRQWFRDLGDIYQRNVQMLPQAQIEQYQRIIDQRLGRPAPLNGEKVKTIESELNHLAGKYSQSSDGAHQLLGEALQDTVTAIRSNLERMNPAYAAELGNINAGYAMYARMRTAAANRRGSEGVFSPGDLLTAVKRADRSVGKGSFARGDALMQDFAEAGQRVLPSKVPDSGTPGRALMSLATAGGLGYLNPKVLAGVGAATLPYNRPAMALLNRYVRPTTGARAAYSQAGRGVGTLRPLLQSNPFGSSPNPFAP